VRPLSVLIAGAGVALGMAIPASASSVDQSMSATAPHCVLTAHEVGAEAKQEEVPRCYSTFPEAVAAATDAGSILGIEYDGNRFGGWSYVIVADGPPCADGHSYGIPRLPAPRDDLISSARSYAGCSSIHFSRADYKGERVRCGCSTMGAMSDRTTSILFRPRSRAVPAG
jgi:hypothetical protein